MKGSSHQGAGRNRPESATTLDELVLHLREAGVKRVYLSKDGVFRDDVISIIATVERQRSEDRGREDTEPETLTDIVDHYSGSRQAEGERAPERERVRSVFEALGNRVRFASEAWTIDWTVRPTYSDPPVDLTTLYDRGVEYKLGDGFNLRNALFVYERYCEGDSSPSEHRAAARDADPRGTYW